MTRLFSRRYITSWIRAGLGTLAVATLLFIGGGIVRPIPVAAQSPVSQLPVATFADIAKGCEGGSFFGLVPWFNYLDVVKSGLAPHECKVCFSLTNNKNFDSDCPNDNTSDIPLVLLAIVDDLLRIAGVVAVAYILYGAIHYITSQGSPDETTKARGAIVNALIGLVIAMVAVSFVSFIGNQLGG